MQPGATFGARTGEACAGDTRFRIEAAPLTSSCNLRRVQNERAMSPLEAAVALPLTSNEPQDLRVEPGGKTLPTPDGTE